jgi:hypothetical protein
MEGKRWQQMHQFHIIKTIKMTTTVFNYLKSSKVVLKEGILGIKASVIKHKLLYPKVIRQAFYQN